MQNQGKFFAVGDPLVTSAKVLKTSTNVRILNPDAIPYDGIDAGRMDAFIQK